MEGSGKKPPRHAQWMYVKIGSIVLLYEKQVNYLQILAN